MPIPDEAPTTRRYLSQISVNLPFVERLVLFDSTSSTKQIKETRRRLIQAPDDVDLLLGLSYLLAIEGQNEAAPAEWRKAHLGLPFDTDVEGEEALSQKNAWAHYILGVILTNRGGLEEAAIEWRKASALERYGVGELARGKLRDMSS